MTTCELYDSVQRKLAQIESLINPTSLKAAKHELTRQNTELKQSVERAKKEVERLELDLGILQYKLPASANRVEDRSSSTITSIDSTVVKDKTTEKPTPQKQQPVKASQPPPASSTSEKQKKGANPVKTKTGGGGGKKGDDSLPVDVGRLDMRLGMIVEVERHPDADTLYVEKVDLGEGRLRTVVSGLVNFVPLEEMQHRVGIFLTNLKPAKMRGIESEAMLMCASAHEVGRVEPLLVDTKSIQLGQSVEVPGFNSTPPDAQLNPKKKIFEQIKPDLRVDAEGFATYKGVRWSLKGDSGAVIKADTLKDVQIA